MYSCVIKMAKTHVVLIIRNIYLFLSVSVTLAFYVIEWKEWSDWSLCNTIDNSECGKNASRRKVGSDCYDVLSNQSLSDHYCGDHGYRIQSCEKYCPGMYTFSVKNLSVKNSSGINIHK